MSPDPNIDPQQVSNGVRHFWPFLLAAGQAQPKVTRIRIIETVISALIIAGLVGIGGYLLAVPRIEQAIQYEATITRRDIDNLEKQFVELKLLWREGQERDERERKALEERLVRQLERSKK